MIVKVNGDIVTLSRNSRAARSRRRRRPRVDPDRVEAFLRENNARILQDAIDDLLILQKAEDVGIKCAREYIEEIIESIKKENNIPSDEAAAGAAAPRGHVARRPEAQHRALDHAASRS